MRTILLVIDGFGIGEMPDASIYGDKGCDTYAAVVDGIRLPNLQRLGLNNIFGSAGEPIASPLGCYGRMRELSAAKDTLTGHHEMAGIITYEPPTTYPNGFPSDVVIGLESAFNSKILGNEVASGTEIINRLGDEHMSSGKPIVYTSADSVLQIACHEDIISTDRLYTLCQYAMDIMRSTNHKVSRIIARPFIGGNGNYTRTENRRDFCVPPSCETLIERLAKNGINSTAIGKISDIFGGVPFARTVSAHNNYEVRRAVLDELKISDSGLIFANFVDTDMLYGHRRDVQGYRKCMEDIDLTIGEIVNKLNSSDMLIVTSDHGCDPSYKQSTDHTREYVPFMVIGDSFKKNVNLNTLSGFDTIAHTVLDYHGVMTLVKSVIPLIKKSTKRKA